MAAAFIRTEHSKANVVMKVRLELGDVDTDVVEVMRGHQLARTSC